MFTVVWGDPAAHVGSHEESLLLEILSTYDPVAWDRVVIGAEGSIFHSSIWARYICELNPRVQPQYVVLRRQDGEPAACCLGFCESSANPILNHLTRIFRTEAVPLSCDGDPAGPMRLTLGN